MVLDTSLEEGQQTNIFTICLCITTGTKLQLINNLLIMVLFVKVD